MNFYNGLNQLIFAIKPNSTSIHTSLASSTLHLARLVSFSCFSFASSADLEVQLVQLNHCDGVYSSYWNTLLSNLKLSPCINFCKCCIIVKIKTFCEKIIIYRIITNKIFMIYYNTYIIEIFQKCCFGTIVMFRNPVNQNVVLFIHGD